jgi:hypothetical protein
MAYTFNNITIDEIDSAGALLYNIGTFTSATIPALTDTFSIGNRIKLTLTIDASGADTFNNRFLRFNPGLYTNANNSNAQRYGYETLNPLNTVAQQANLALPSNNEEKTNIYCEMSCNAGGTTATVVFIFYVTYDTRSYITSQGQAFNINRLIAASSTGAFNNSGTNSSSYRQTSNIGIVSYVYDNSGFGLDVSTPTGAKFMNIPIRTRWYNSDYNGITTGMRYIKEFEVSSASQVAASLPLLSDITSTSSQTQTQTAIAQFTITSNQLAVGEANNVRILLRGDAFVGSVNNPAISDIRILLFTLNNVTNTNDFVTDIMLSDAVIPQATPGSGQLNGAIYSPSDWFENVPAADDIEVQFVIDGTQLILNNNYYIVVNVHDSANPDYVTSHLTPALAATYTAPAIPTLTGYLSTYNTQYSGNELTIAPHQRIKARLEIDKTSYATALTALGLTGTFDGSVAGIICKLTNVPGVVNQVQGFIPAAPPITTADMTIITNDATDLVLDCIFRIAEEYAGTSTEITWTVNMNQPTSVNGITQLTQIDFVQKLDVDVFENDAISPNLLAVRFYDLADYILGIKTEIIDICDADQIIAEVEKDSTFTGSINLIATIYPANELGNTNNNAIEEECNWAPIVVQMQQLVSGKLDDVDNSFGGDDFATFKINVQQLTLGQRYWVTAIAFQQVPDYCPIGLVSVINSITQRSLTALPGWYVTGDPTNLINEILAHPDYVGGLTIVQNNVTDSANNQVGLITSYVGNVVTATRIDLAIVTAYYTIVIDANFDPGTGPHTIRHELKIANAIPPANVPPIGTFGNAYICTDLG